MDDEREGATWTYRYDQGGNMLEKKRYGYTLAADLDGLTPEQVIPYAYGDTNWKDRLTAYDGKLIACDPIGNPLFYDAQGRSTMVRYNDTDYAYLQNLQGDVTGIVDMNGAVVVEYGYDAWGKPIVTTGSMAETLGYDNPFRYKGYVYDEETGLYYLRSRYYDPVWGRFVNADILLGKPGVLLSHNGFAYCNNSPVNGSDPTGLSSGSPFERDESPWDWSNVTNPSQEKIIEINNGFKKDGVTVSRKATGGKGELYVPVLDETFMVRWSSIGKYHLDIFPKSEGRNKIMTHFGFTREEPGTLDQWNAKNAWEPVEAYLEFKGHIVAGSVNLMLHSGSGKNVELNTAGGNICFYTHNSKQTSPKISSLVQKHRNAAIRAYEFAKSMRWKQWLVEK